MLRWMPTTASAQLSQLLISGIKDNSPKYSTYCTLTISCVTHRAASGIVEDIIALLMVVRKDLW
jgi:hypothetical protein